jgi:DNA replication protein DnaC
LVPVSKWYDIFGEQTIADAILDRIVHDAHRPDPVQPIREVYNKG